MYTYDAFNNQIIQSIHSLNFRVQVLDHQFQNPPIPHFTLLQLHIHSAPPTHHQLSLRSLHFQPCM